MRKLKVLSFNLGLLRVNIRKTKIFEFTPYLEERFSKIVEKLKTCDADIISLQEIYNKLDALALIEELKSIFPYHFYPRPNHYMRYSSGLLVLSKLPLKKPTFQKFKRSTWDEKLYVDKGFIDTHVDFDDFLVQIVNAHTTAGGYFKHPESKSVDKIRDSQIKQILNATNSKTHMTVITGDMNCGPQASKQNFELFEKEGFQDVFQYKDNSLYTWDVKNPLNANSIHSSSPSQRIDHILYQVHEKREWDHGDSQIIYKEGIVKVKTLLQKEELVTLSDHYGVESNIVS